MPVSPVPETHGLLQGRRGTIETDVLIVGAGPAALYAVFQLGLLGLSSQVVEVLPQPGGQCEQLYADKPLYDIPGMAHTTGAALTQALLAQVKPFTHPAPESPVRQATQFFLEHLVTGFEVQNDGRFRVQTTHTLANGPQFVAHALVMAAGVGAFLPKKPIIEGLAAIESHHVVYGPPTSEQVQGKHLVIQGDDDQAVALALEHATALAKGHPHAPASTTLLHRRAVLSAQAALQDQFNTLVAKQMIRFVVGQATYIEQQADGQMVALQIARTDGTPYRLPTDLWVPLLGLSPKLGPLEHWGLAMSRKAVVVNPATCESSIAGVYAIGDMAQYAGKRKLIVSGFQDATLAAYAIAERKEGQKVLLQYTTASRQLHARLGR